MGGLYLCYCVSPSKAPEYKAPTVSLRTGTAIHSANKTPPNKELIAPAQKPPKSNPTGYTRAQAVARSMNGAADKDVRRHRQAVSQLMKWGNKKNQEKLYKKQAKAAKK